MNVVARTKNSIYSHAEPQSRRAQLGSCCFEKCEAIWAIASRQTLISSNTSSLRLCVSFLGAATEEKLSSSTDGALDQLWSNTRSEIDSHAEPQSRRVAWSASKPLLRGIGSDLADDIALDVDLLEDHFSASLWLCVSFFLRAAIEEKLSP